MLSWVWWCSLQPQRKFLLLPNSVKMLELLKRGRTWRAHLISFYHQTQCRSKSKATGAVCHLLQGVRVLLLESGVCSAAMSSSALAAPGFLLLVLLFLLPLAGTVHLLCLDIAERHMGPSWVCGDMLRPGAQPPFQKWGGQTAQRSTHWLIIHSQSLGLLPVPPVEI